MDRTDNTLKILAAVSSILFLLIAIKTSYPAESIGDMTVNIAGKFVTYELILFSAIYVAGPMISEAMPGIWEETRKFLRKQHSYHVTKTDTPIITSSRLLLPAHIISQDTVHNQEDAINIDIEDEDAGIVAMEDEVSDEIIEYTYKTFENILTTEQIEKIFSNLRKFNNVIILRWLKKQSCLTIFTNLIFYTLYGTSAKEYITKDIAIINSEIAQPNLQNHLFHLQLHLHLKVLVPQ